MSDAAAPTNPAENTKYRYLVMFLLFLVYAFNFLDRQILVLAANRGPQIGLTSYRTVAPREEERSDGGVDSLVAIAENGRPIAEPVVDILVAVEIKQPRTLGVVDVDRLVFAPIAEIGCNTERQPSHRFLEMLAGSVELAVGHDGNS